MMSNLKWSWLQNEGGEVGGDPISILKVFVNINRSIENILMSRSKIFTKLHFFLHMLCQSYSFQIEQPILVRTSYPNFG
jgi:hypothetical protein